jgi:hypothetical protein
LDFQGSNACRHQGTQASSENDRAGATRDPGEPRIGKAQKAREGEVRKSIKAITRKITLWAWDEVVFNIARVEWKFGRHNNGRPKNWKEWNNVRDNLRELKRLRKPEELENEKGNKP